MASFKHHANAADLREVQCAVLWEWAVSTSLPLPHAAAVFCRDYRRIWPLLQLGDPLIQDDRMFSVDQRDVLIILRKQEERYGRYDTGSSTDPSTNIFQKVTVALVAHGPVWVRNTQGPRSHVEGLLRKYGVPYRPSHSPGVRMTVRPASARTTASLSRFTPDAHSVLAIQIVPCRSSSATAR